MLNPEVILLLFKTSNHSSENSPYLMVRTTLPMFFAIMDVAMGFGCLSQRERFTDDGPDFTREIEPEYFVHFALQQSRTLLQAK